MRTKIAKCRIVLFGSASGSLAMAPAIAFPGLRNSRKTPRLTSNKLARSHGRLIQELEREVGDLGLRYSLDIKAEKIVQEVGVDAMRGASWRMPKKEKSRLKITSEETLKDLCCFSNRD